MKGCAPAADRTGKSGAGLSDAWRGNPEPSGGEAQRLKLAGEMGKGQSDTVFIFDEPTIGRIRWTSTC